MVGCQLLLLAAECVAYSAAKHCLSATSAVLAAAHCGSRAEIDAWVLSTCIAAVGCAVQQQAAAAGHYCLSERA